MFVEYQVCARYFTRTFTEALLLVSHLCEVNVSSPFFFHIRNGISENFK